ncbi:MAG: PilC/PilY family type IV pilus protein [Rhodocyclaceae bacterium]|nr:PilC/PilY family type IV pilus protein [Rhodocyclaceae bacterium]
MKHLRVVKQLAWALMSASALTAAGQSLAAPLNLATEPLITIPPDASAVVRPNLFFILDNSGSMNWDYLPDYVVDYNLCKGNTGTASLRCCRNPSGTAISSASTSSTCLPQNISTGANLDGGSTTYLRGLPPFHSSAFNSVYYNPEITYAPPKNADGTSKTSYSGTGATPWDGYNVQYGSGDTITLTSQFPDVQWCTNTSYTDCLRADNYLVPGTVSGKSYTTMRATTASGTGSFVTGTPASPTTASRSVGPYFYTIVPGEYCTTPKLTDCATQNTPSVARPYPATVRWCNNSAGRVAGEPGASSGNACQAVRNSTFQHPRYPTLLLSSSPATYVPGRWVRTDIVSGGSYGNLCVNSSGTVTQRAGACLSGETAVIDRSRRTDCAARPACTYAEELANFANWFAWYRSRMQMAKSALSHSFVGLDERNRVGYFTINAGSGSTNNASNYYLLNIAPFNATQKNTFFTRLFAADPTGSTPLRIALANAGRIYAGKTAITGATDPVQYSCQKNYTILSTDGYWNGGNGKKIDGTTDIGNEDATGMVIGGVTGPFADSYTATLADVAAYYYKTDLRDPALGNCTGALGAGINVCTNDVPSSSNPVDDKNPAQHMVTFTIGLGIPGVMKYRSDYTSDTTDATDDYKAVRDGTTANPAAGICPWQTSGACNWPNPQTSSSSEIQERIDDLWHAAVNGHGKYYSAGDAQALRDGLNNALASIQSDDGSGAAATTSNPNVTTGDNFVFSSKYWTVRWTGEFYRQTMDPTTGNIAAAHDWDAHTLLDAATWSSRKILTFDPSGTPRNFQWSSLNDSNGSVTNCAPPQDEKDCFSAAVIASGLSQWGSLTTSEKALAEGQNLVNYLRGEKTYEWENTENPNLYRKREARLGDIVHSEAVYVGKYLYDYGYGTSNNYPTRGTDRDYPTVYVAANDGMLHAFNAGPVSHSTKANDTNYGAERWAYIPSMVIKNLYRLASKDYAHRYFVDGTPVAGDVQDGSSWKTILVGGLAGGGPGYYALDITDQQNPKVLWEFRQKSGCTATSPTGSSRYSSSGRMTEDCDLGYSYGNPIIAKIPGGTWVVMVTSGYNNHTGGDGKGYLYILNALTGAVMGKVSTGVGDTTTPSGLAKINAWADNAMIDNTAKYVYGGDLLGNMWKFDLTGCTGTSTCTPVKSLLINVGSTKPITAKPELGEVVKSNGQKKRIVFFPTGSLLSNDDLAVTATQSFYGIWDADSGAPTTIVPATATGTTTRTGVVKASVFEDDNNLGWQLDFPGAGERGNTDPQLAFGTLVFTTNMPGSSNPCNPSGFTSWLWNVDYKSGGVVELPGETNTMLARQYAGAATRPNIVVLPSGVVKSITRVTGQEVQNIVDEVRIGTTATGARRVSWRELLN